MANNRESKIGGRALVATLALVMLAFAFFVWGGSVTHVASNPGPSGMPESNIINETPPPANGPSETTIGTAR
jgi:hypothetical protein